MVDVSAFYIGDSDDNENLLDETYLGYSDAFVHLREMLVTQQDDVDSGEAEGGASLSIYSTAGGNLAKVFEGWPIVPATHVFLKDREGYFEVSFGLLAGSLIGGQAKNWRLVSRFVEPDGSFTFLGLYKTKEVSAFVPFICRENKLVIEMTHLMEKKEQVPMDVSHQFLEFDGAELRSLFLDQTRVSDIYSKTHRTRSTEVFKGTLDTCSLTLTQPIGRPNNANAYTFQVETQQAMLVNGEETHFLEFTLVGDWEVTDFIEAVSKIPKPDRLA